MAQRYRAGQMVAVEDVRNELYQLLNQVQMWKNEHLFAWQKKGEPCAPDCKCCERYENRKTGVREAIRRFGGRPTR